VITRADVAAAASRIAGRVRRTPELRVDESLSLKLEYLQHTGSFKARGAFNRVLSAAETGELTDAGIIAASGGNAGLAFAYAARTAGYRAEVYVPEIASPVKVAKLRGLGATVVQVGSEYVAAYEAARKRQADTGAVFCHAYDQPEVVAGQGTLALELGPTDTVLVAVGGGGLMAGIVGALDGRARVVGVEPVLCPTLHAALAAGEPVDVSVGGVAADSLGARRVGEIAYQMASWRQVPSLLVDDDAIVAARRDLWQRYRLVVEYGAAAAWAALLTGAYRPAEGERVTVILCGANTDPADLA
jgi:threonine dehydratase